MDMLKGKTSRLLHCHRKITVADFKKSLFKVSQQNQHALISHLYLKTLFTLSELKRCLVKFE